MLTPRTYPESQEKMSLHPKHAMPIERLEGRTLFATVPAGFTATVFTAGFANATSMAFAPDGRLFVTQQAGDVRVVHADGALQATPFVHVNTDPAGERGLLGLAFDPNFQSDHYVYVYYTVPASGSTPSGSTSMCSITTPPRAPTGAG